MNGVHRQDRIVLGNAQFDVDESRINQAYFAHDPKRGVNMGIAQVVPVQKITETINCPELTEDPAAAEQRYLSSLLASEDKVQMDGTLSRVRCLSSSVEAVKPPACQVRAHG